MKCIFYVLLLINNYVGEKKPFHPEAKTEITKNSRLPKGLFSLYCLFFFTYVDNACVVGGEGGNLKGGVVGGEWGSFSRVGGGGRIWACYYVDP